MALLHHFEWICFFSLLIGIFNFVSFALHQFICILHHFVYILCSTFNFFSFSPQSRISLAHCSTKQPTIEWTYKKSKKDDAIWNGKSEEKCVYSMYIWMQKGNVCKNERYKAEIKAYEATNVYAEKRGRKRKKKYGK